MHACTLSIASLVVPVLPRTWHGVQLRAPLLAAQGC